MNTLLMWSLVLGFFTPPVLAIIQQPKWSNQVRSIVTFVFGLLVGFVNVVLNGDLSKAADWTSAILIVLVAAISTYKGFWKPSGIAPKIETATSTTQTPGH